MSESKTYPWSMVTIGQEQFVKIKEAEFAYDDLRGRTDVIRANLVANCTAAGHLATRAVIAEAKAVELERERDALREDREGWKRSFIDQERSYRTLWVEFWLRQGFDLKRVRRALEDTFRLKPDQTEWVLGSRACYSLDADHKSSDDQKRWSK